jgi:hypothetical protein
MQVIGLSEVTGHVGTIAARAMSPAVAEWARRVVSRHIRRTRELLVPLPSAAAVRNVATADGLAPEVVARLVAARQAGEEIVAPDRDRIAAFVTRAIDTMDFMASLPADDRRIRRIERMSWLDAEKMSEEWHLALARQREKVGDLSEGTRRLADFDDGSYVVQLMSDRALKAEGAAMGHCVGGYWRQVSSGGVRIVSLRDASGQPHVTIELGRLDKVMVEGLGMRSLMNGLSAGANLAAPADFDWFARQIRGKQNQSPVEKYADKVRKWLAHAQVPSSEYGFKNSVRGAGFETVYAVTTADGKRFDLTRSADDAFAKASEIAREKLRGDPMMVKHVTDRMRLSSIARDVEDTACVEGFVSGLVGDIVSHIETRQARDASHVLGEIRQSGIEKFVIASVRDRNVASAMISRLYGYLVSHDRERALESHDLPIIDAGRTSGLVARVHDLPSVGLHLMHLGKASGMEDLVLDGMQPKLLRILKEMKARSDVYHVIRPTTAGVRPAEIMQAFFACGLGPEYVKATGFVKAGARVTVKGLNLELKKLREKGVNVNLEKNLLGEGYEKRVEGLIADRLNACVLVVGPEPTKAPVLTIRPSARTTPPIKSYAMPRR